MSHDALNMPALPPSQTPVNESHDVQEDATGCFDHLGDLVSNPQAGFELGDAIAPG